MDGADGESVLGGLMWTDLEVGPEGHVTVNELGRYLRQNGMRVSNFAIFRILADNALSPQFTMDHEMFLYVKQTILKELQNQTDVDEEGKRRKYRAQYLDLWREHSHSKDDTGEIPVSQLANVVFAECNPTRQLLDVLKDVKNDGSESLNFMEFCEMLENIPSCGVIDQSTLLAAFRSEDVDGSGYLTRTQLYQLLIENGSDPLQKEDVDEMMEDCGVGDRFKYTDWIQRVVTKKELSEK